MTVISEQAGISGKPHEPLVVLRDAANPVFELLAIRGERNEAEILFVDDRKYLYAVAPFRSGGGAHADDDKEYGVSAQDRRTRPLQEA
jgi:hypothetical protein